MTDIVRCLVFGRHTVLSCDISSICMRGHKLHLILGIFVQVDTPSCQIALPNEAERVICRSTPRVPSSNIGRILEAGYYMAEMITKFRTIHPRVEHAQKRKQTRQHRSCRFSQRIYDEGHAEVSVSFRFHKFISSKL